jgi:hypothetical protein
LGRKGFRTTRIAIKKDENTGTPRTGCSGPSQQGSREESIRIGYQDVLAGMDRLVV